MTLVAGRMPGLHSLERSAYPEDGSMQGILKSGPTRRPNRSVRTEVNPYIGLHNQVEHNQRNDDGKRLVRFCETEENEKQNKFEKQYTEAENNDVIMFGSNMYFVNNSDPNSAVRKLFPNSKLTPINPFVNRSNVKNNSHSQVTKSVESNHNIFTRSKSKSDNEDGGSRNTTKRKIDRNVLRRNLLKVPPETKPKPGKTNVQATPLIERIKQLTCDSEDAREEKKIEKEQTKFDSTLARSHVTETTKPLHMQELNHHQIQKKFKDLPKQTKEGLNLMRYNQNISQTRSQVTEKKPTNPNKMYQTDEARRSFLSSLSQENEEDPEDRSSGAGSSTTAETVYSLSDIEEALTEEEKEIKEAFAQENKQDELELFVQQDAGRTERLRKRYSSTPKPENSIPVIFSNSNFSPKNLNMPHFMNGNCTMKKDKPKFGSTIEILQQLQQQIETPYQLEGRRTACSNYSDSSIPISERLFCDESSDGYEPIQPKLNVHRTCSLDSKNYEEIDNFSSAFSVPRTKSHEHPCLTHLESDPYFYPLASARYSGSFGGRNPPLDQSIYASSPDLHGHHLARIPDRFSSYNYPANPRQLHPVLQKQYCRYPVNDVPRRPAEEGKVLTPPSRMHTYMNVPTNAPCYLSPPSYSQVSHYGSPPAHPDVYHYETPHTHSNIYQNIPLQTNPHMMTIRRLCTERERGVPEGASSSHDSKEIFPSSPDELFYTPSIATIPKPSSLLHHYCVDV